MVIPLVFGCNRLGGGAHCGIGTGGVADGGRLEPLKASPESSSDSFMWWDRGQGGQTAEGSSLFQASPESSFSSFMWSAVSVACL